MEGLLLGQLKDRCETMTCEDNERLILPTDENLLYMGRIEDSNKEAPFLIYPYTMVKTCFTGTKIRIWLRNYREYWDNYLGVIIDGIQKKILLPGDDSEVCLTLAENLKDCQHELIIFKRMDACHVIAFLGLCIGRGAYITKPSEWLPRRIEVFGDSVTAGEVSEAVEYAGKKDPEHQGEYSNSWYSYAALAARKLNAQLHSISQGGIALMAHTGWYAAPECIGMEDIWDKVIYNSRVSEDISWDFRRYIPQVVIVAVGQNDNQPFDYMAENYDCPQAVNWRSHYKKFVERIREKYPKALIILATTILEHHANWDKSINAVCHELGDTKIVHFLYSNNGSGTPGHIRVHEAEQMAGELAEFIESFGNEIWG